MFDMSESRRKVMSNKRRTGEANGSKGWNNFPFKGEYDKLLFSGGEPSLHSDFFAIVSQVKGWRVEE